jgi:hypothetical protein
VRTRLAVAAAALLTMTGCGADLGPEFRPGAAAVAGDTTISMSDVDAFADDYCSLFHLAIEQRGGQGVPMGQIRTFAVNSMLEDELVRQFAEEKGIEPDRAAFREQTANLAAEAEQIGIPAKDVATYETLREREVFAGQVKLEAGRQALEATGAAVTPQAAAERGAVVYAEWRDNADFTIDPRFGRLDAEFGYVPGSQYLSVPVSELARGAYAPAPDPAYVATLPASQVCS